MIIWGGWIQLAGYSASFNTGGRYNPARTAWTATSTTNAPSARVQHTAVWTGSEMIVWGGARYSGDCLTPAGDTIPARTVGQLLAPLTRLLAEVVTRQFGPSVK